MGKLNDLRVLGLEVENVKRIRVVRIQPGTGLVEVSGRNRQGKTSLLDSIEMAIGGGKKIPWEPIRKGEGVQHAMIRMDLGNDEGLQLRLTRTFRPSEDGAFKTTLRVEDADGFQPKGAQTLLDSIVNGMSFDPEAFCRAKDDEQAAILRGLVPDFDFAAADAGRKLAFDHRTEERREAKRLQAAADAVDVPAGTPTEAIDTAALVAELRAIGETTAAIARERSARTARINSAEVMRDERLRWIEKAKDLREEADRLDRLAADHGEMIAEIEDEVRALPELEAEPDGARIEIQIAEATETNRAVAALANRADLARRAKACADSVARYDAAIAAIDKSVADAIGGADFPVSGLSILDGRVMLRGVPFSQGSTAEQLRTSMAIGMAMNPRLKVIRVRQGAMLDDEAWAIIGEAAAEQGFQVWAETISPHDANAIVMVDGEVAS